MTDCFVYDAVRTPRGRGKKETGALAPIHPQELYAQTLNALVERNGFDPREVEDVVGSRVGRDHHIMGFDENRGRRNDPACQLLIFDLLYVVLFSGIFGYFAVLRLRRRLID